MAEETKQETPAASGAAKAPAQLRALLGEKIGMTQVFNKDGELKAVTVVQAGPCAVVRVKAKDGKDGYSAVVVGFGAVREKSLNKAELGLFKKAGLQPMRHLKEFRLADVSGIAAGQAVDVSRFAPGDFVDVQGSSKGKGFAGVMKRHNFRGMPASHGASDKERSPGSLTSRRSLGKVLKGQRMAGHMGDVTVTMSKLEVLQVEPETNKIYVHGPVPGANGSVVSILETSKNLKRRVVREKVKQVKRDKMGNIIQEKASPKKKAK
ncbi:MAG TPA: 50S ribosomal protein L3 [Elusimicrobiota bacterium]|jgi:large subunit ribosomal protein L3|nr:50S ribosomal protein L3 [Elusimicrobiota bacterium]